MPDAYDRRARLAPVYLTAFPLLPLASVSVAALPGWFKLAAVAWFAVPYLLEELARDRGKRLENDLWSSWGGGPAMTALRWRSASNPVLMQERHRTVERLTGTRLPDRSHEDCNHVEADNRYDAVVDTLLVLTKDGQPRLKAELARYGFRRNLWGMKPVGISISVLALVGSAIGVFLSDAAGSRPAYAVSGAVCLFALALWIVIINTEWVHRQADLYAAELFKTVKAMANSSRLSTTSTEEGGEDA